MAELARALIFDPVVLLLDEPFAGVHPKLKEELMNVFRVMNSRGKTLIVVSHDIKSVLKLSKRIIVMVEGKMLVEGVPEKVMHEACVIEAYLGRK